MSEHSFQMIPVGSIMPNPGNPRKRFDQVALEELAASLKEHGVVEPLVVTETGSDYLLICGERRWRAARLAGLETLPCIVRDIDATAAAEIMIVENLQRQDLDPVEEAEGFRELLDNHGYSLDTLAQRVGLSAGQVEARLRVLRLPEEVREAVAGRTLAPTAALELLRVEGTALFKELAKRFVDDPPAARAAQETVRREITWKGREVVSNRWEFPFDLSECQRCPRSSVVNVETNGGTQVPKRYCLDSKCREAKKTAWEKAETEAAMAAAGDLGDAVDGSKLGANDYVPMERSYQWRGIDPAQCETCESRRPVRFSNVTKICCINAVCHNNKRAAADAAEKAADEAEEKMRVQRVLAAVAARTREISDGDMGHLTREQVRFLVIDMLTSSRNGLTDIDVLMRHGFKQTGKLWQESWSLNQRVQELMAYLDGLTTTKLVELLFIIPAYGRHQDVRAGWVREFFGLTDQVATAEEDDDAEDDQEDEIVQASQEAPRAAATPSEPEAAPAEADDSEGKPESNEFAGFMCPECGSEMEHVVYRLSDQGSVLECANSECLHTITEDEARLIMQQENCPEDQATEEGTAKESVETVGGQPAAWVDPKTGKHYELSQGLGDADGPWGLFERKENGSLRRVKGVEMQPGRLMAWSAACEYAEAHGWETVSTVAREEEAGDQPEPFRADA